MDSRTLERGIADLILETDAGYVVIDHKSFPGAEDKQEEKAAGFAGQLRAYAATIQEATGKDVLGVYVHMPVVGRVYKVGDG